MKPVPALITVGLLAACSQDAGDTPSAGEAPPSAEVVVVEAAKGPDGLLPPLDGENVWRIDKDASALMFSGRQGDDEFTGRFGDFDAQIRLNPDDLASASIVAAVDLGSVDAGSSDRNQSLPEADWFDIARFPRATFRSSIVRATGQGAYAADGTLTIKGVDRAITLPFTLETEGDRAVANGQFTLDRSLFGIGRGDFAGPEWVDTAIGVTLHIEAAKG